MRDFFKHILFFVVLSVFAMSIFAQPADYYNSAAGKSREELKTALFNIINEHTVVSYDAIWTFYEKTDAAADSSIEDIYSDCNFKWRLHQSTGGASSECGSYNREHSFPKSWFGGENQFPMFTDLHHIYPTDAYNNSRRNNNPYGIVGIPEYTTCNGGKLGYNIAGNYYHRVFEPADDYKGDLARTYFYMITRYENLLNSWYNNYAATTEVEDVLDGTSYPALQNWYLKMLYQWHINDPVSEKEIARNDSIYLIQGNRNPFIDNPEWVSDIWQDFLAVNPLQTPKVSFNKESALYYDSVTVALTCPDSHATIYYTTDGNIPSMTSTEYTAPVFLTNSTVVRAFAYNTENPLAESDYNYGVFFVETLDSNYILTFNNSIPITEGSPAKIDLYCNYPINVASVDVSNPDFEINKNDVEINFEDFNDAILVYHNERKIDSTDLILSYSNKNIVVKLYSSDDIVGWRFQSSNTAANIGLIRNIGISISNGTGRIIEYNTGAKSLMFKGFSGTNATAGLNYIETDFFNTRECVNLKLKFKQTGSNTAPRDWKIMYKVGESQQYPWTDCENSSYIVTNDGNGTNAQATDFTYYEIALSPEMEHQANVKFRWCVTSNTSISNANINANANTYIGEIDVVGDYGINDAVQPQFKQNSDKIMLFPSPAKDILNVQCEKCKVQNLEILDINGKLQFSTILHNFAQFSTSIDISQLKSGTYTLKIGNEIAKFVKE